MAVASMRSPACANRWGREGQALDLTSDHLLFPSKPWAIAFASTMFSSVKNDEASSHGDDG